MNLACIQSDCVFGRPEQNVQRVLAEVERSRESGADLVVFPEAFLTGYCADCEDAAHGIALPIGSPLLAEIRKACDDRGTMLAVGFAESDEGALYNSVAFFQPNRPMSVYRKSHLPFLGYDRFARPGHDLPVFETSHGRIGILICFDLRIPEAARTLALKGADLILVPTNWPEGAEVSADHIAIARAAENRVFLAAVNRVGRENGFRFIGRSKVVAPSGKVLAEARDGEETLLCEIDLAEARVKRAVTIPGQYETDAFASRQPDLYRSLMEKLHPSEPM
jgi:predicted amidohydrolase